MERFFRLWCSGAILRRGVKSGIIVGTVLSVLNHGDAFARGEVTAVTLFKIALTPIVPFFVSTISQVLALMDAPDVGAVAAKER